MNAGGAWIDAANSAFGLPTQLMGGSRGSHLVADSPDLLQALKGRMVYFGTPDGRVNLLCPFAGKVLVGANDIAQPDPDSARCSDDAAAYLCCAVAEVFPDLPILPEQIVCRFCGARPLPRSDGAVGSVTRDHSIITLTVPGTRIPMHCLIGGKWTTFRAFAELASDRVLVDLGRVGTVSTAGLAIGGGRRFLRCAEARRTLAERPAQRSGVTAERADLLLSRFGTRAEDYLTAQDCTWARF